MQVSLLLQLECIAGSLHPDPPPTAPSSRNKFRASSPELPPEPSPSSPGSASSGGRRAAERCGSLLSQAAAAPPIASPHAGSASPSSVLMVTQKEEKKMKSRDQNCINAQPTAHTVQPATGATQCSLPGNNTIKSLRSVDSELRLQEELRISRRTPPPPPPRLGLRRSAGSASRAPETRGAFPCSLHASQRDSLYSSSSSSSTEDNPV